MGEVVPIRDDVEMRELAPDQVVLDWADLMGYIKAAAFMCPTETKESIEVVMDKALKGEALVAYCEVAGERVATVVLEIMPLREGRALLVRYLRGTRMGEWLDVLTDWLQDVAKEEGCTHVALNGRPGWFRELSRFGYRPCMAQMICEVPA